MKARTFLGTLSVHVGEYENMVRYLLVASNKLAAEGLLEAQAASYPGSGHETPKGGERHTNAGGARVSAHEVVEIELTSFWDLQPHLPVLLEPQEVAPPAGGLDSSGQYPQAAVKRLLLAAREVTMEADSSGCSEDLTVTSASAMEDLEAALEAFN
jgi:hypothetical protein